MRGGARGTGPQDGVAGVVRTRPGAADTPGADLDGLRRRGDLPFLRDQLADGESPVDVGAEDGLDLIQRPAFQDGGRSEADLLGGLEQHKDVPVGRLAREKMRRADGPRRVDVMPAGVHHPVVFRCPIEAGLFVDR